MISVLFCYKGLNYICLLCFTFPFVTSSLISSISLCLFLPFRFPFTSMAANNANSPTCCQKENEPLENDTLMESDSSKNTFKPELVSPFTSGEGLPYAPEGWPKPGDIWGWKVGRRTTRAGYYTDRYLYLPRSLVVNPSIKRWFFQSKPEVERYIKSNFPDMEIEAFFSSFSWKVPSTELSPPESEAVTGPPIKFPETGKDAANEIATQRAKGRSSPTRRSRRSRRLVRPYFSSDVQDDSDIIDLTSLNQEANIKSTKDLKLRQPENSFLAACNLVDSNEGSGLPIALPEQSPNVTIAENFDDYLSTLEEIIVLPCTEIPLSDPVVPATNLEYKMTECRSKLSSLLAMDLSSLASSDILSEVVTLASQLQKDPSLSIDQLIKLKLLEEIQLVSEAFKEAKDNIEEADKFLSELEAKKLKVSSLKREYSELKNRLSQLQLEIDTSSSAIQEIDDQILQLQSKRREMRSAFEIMNKRKLELTCTQAMVANSIPSIVGEIQHANSEKPKWEMKKAKCVERVAEIQQRFSTLRGLTF